MRRYDILVGFVLTGKLQSWTKRLAEVLKFPAIVLPRSQPPSAYLTFLERLMKNIATLYKPFSPTLYVVFLGDIQTLLMFCAGCRTSLLTIADGGQKERHALAIKSSCSSFIRVQSFSISISNRNKKKCVSLVT